MLLSAETTRRRVRPHQSRVMIVTAIISLTPLKLHGRDECLGLALDIIFLGFHISQEELVEEVVDSKEKCKNVTIETVHYD